MKVLLHIFNAKIDNYYLIRILYVLLEGIKLHDVFQYILLESIDLILLHYAGVKCII